MTTEVQPPFDLSMAIKAHLNMKEKIKKLEQQIGQIEAKQQVIEDAIRAHMDSAGGVTSLSAAGVGRAVKRTTSRLYSTDMPELKRWAVTNAAQGALELFENRLHQGNTEAWIKENPKNIPPGLQSQTKTSIVISNA